MTGPDNPDIDWLLQAVGIHKRFGDNEVLRGVSVQARQGDVISMIGSSGSGKSTLLRCITPGACSSSARRPSATISPKPSMGAPSGSTTRPRNASPTGTDRTSPVRVTSMPSSTPANSPSTTTPISFSSRFWARPSVPSANLMSSLAITPGSPST